MSALKPSVLISKSCNVQIDFKSNEAVPFSQISHIYSCRRLWGNIKRAMIPLTVFIGLASFCEEAIPECAAKMLDLGAHDLGQADQLTCLSSACA